MNRFTSMALALVMSLCVSAPAFASEGSFAAVPSEEVVTPHPRLIAQSLHKTNTDKTNSAAANPDDGDYLRFYYRNDTKYACTAYLIRIDGTREKVVGSMAVPGEDQNQAIFFRIGAGSGTYKIKVENTENGGLVSGYAALAQYLDLTDMPDY